MNTTAMQIIVLAKEPVPGLVKTRLCPPCTPSQAAAVAAAALADTIHTVNTTPARRRVLVLQGSWPTPSGWLTVPQRGHGLDERLAYAFADTALPDSGSLLLGMDTPQVTIALLNEASSALDGADAALGPAEDGGWWALALREPRHGGLLRGITTSVADTGARTLDALRGHGLHVVLLPTLRDVDTAADAQHVARSSPGGRFADAVRRHMPASHVPADDVLVDVGAVR